MSENDVDRHYINRLNQNYAPNERVDFAQSLAEHDRRIAQVDQQIAEACRMHEHDPAYWGQHRQHFERLRAALLQHRAELEQRHRSEQPAGGAADEWRPTSGAVWLNDRY